MIDKYNKNYKNNNKNKKVKIKRNNNKIILAYHILFLNK